MQKINPKSVKIVFFVAVMSIFPPGGFALATDLLIPRKVTDNGVSCMAISSQASFSRSVAGMTNVSGSTQGVICPLSFPVHELSGGPDGGMTPNPKIYEVEVIFSGTVNISCVVVGKNAAGNDVMSHSVTGGGPFYGLRSIEISGFTQSPNIGLNARCYMPSGSTLVGVVTRTIQHGPSQGT